jgi:hypothetical protein
LYQLFVSPHRNTGPKLLPENELIEPVARTSTFAVLAPNTAL